MDSETFATLPTGWLREHACSLTNVLDSRLSSVAFDLPQFFQNGHLPSDRSSFSAFSTFPRFVTFQKPKYPMKTEKLV